MDQLIFTPEALLRDFIDMARACKAKIASQAVTAPSRRLTKVEIACLAAKAQAYEHAASCVESHIKTLALLADDVDGSYHHLADKLKGV